jgi:hypothetical protein
VNKRQQEELNDLDGHGERLCERWAFSGLLTAHASQKTLSVATTARSSHGRICHSTKPLLGVGSSLGKPRELAFKQRCSYEPL